MKRGNVIFHIGFIALVFLVILPNITSAQLSDEAIQEAHRYSASGAGLGMIVQENGKVRFEKYYNGHSAKKPLHIFSGTKSFFGVLAAIGVEEGWLNLDELVAQTIPEWRDDPRKRQITIRELLNFTSGLETGFSQIYGRTKADKLTLSIGLDAAHDRGKTFVYGPGHLQVFCEVLRRKLGKNKGGYEAYLRAKIISPLRINITRWTEDAHGNVIPSAGMYITGRDWLKFGQMIVAGGRWKNHQIVDTENLRRCFSGTRINPAYGLNFWLNGYATQADSRVADVEEWLDRDPMPLDWNRACLSKAAPPDMVVALGSNFQRLYIVPSMQLVVVHLGKKTGKFRDDEFLTKLFSGATFPDTKKLSEKGKPRLPKVFFRRFKKINKP